MSWQCPNVHEGTRTFFIAFLCSQFFVLTFFLSFLPRDVMRRLSAVFAVARCRVCLSIRLSRWCIVTHGWRYRQTSFVGPIASHSSSFDSQCQYPIPSGTPSAGRKIQRGGKLLRFFDWNRRLSRKRYEIGSWLLWNVNRKSYAL